jgi:sterol desaturase/sphingolipid hydroxylase (fatty acid hydroxylase superfamily)
LGAELHEAEDSVETAVELFQSMPNPNSRGGFLLLTLIFIAAEYLYAKLSHHDDHHDARETVATLGVALGHFIAQVLTGGLVAVCFLFAYQYRVFEIPMTVLWAWFALFFAVEFCYYWFHRASHRVRWLWATHAVHHSATHFNLSAAIRLGWTGQLTGAFVFFLPLAIIGFHPIAIGAMMALGLMYQFFLHAAVPYSLGPLEYVLNTPTHHRVHHASNSGCLDKNYGSTLIIFDRLFGTFAKAPVDEKLRYGLKNRDASHNPVWIALGEWVWLFRDVRNARGSKTRIRMIFGPP